MTKKITLESISKQIEKGFSAVADDIVEVKEDVADIKDRLSVVEKKVSGIYNVLTEDARKAKEMGLPRRVHELELKVFKSSKHPVHLTL